MKNVLIMTNNMNGGGAEHVLLTLLRHLPRSRYSIDLCLVYREGVLLDRLPSDLSISAIFEERTPESAECIRADEGELYQRAVRRKYDIEIAFLEGNAVKIMSRSNNRDAVKIAWVHLDLSREHYTKTVYKSTEQEKEAFLSFNHIFCVSCAVLGGLERLFGPDLRERSYIVFNPIEHEEIMRLAEIVELQKHGVTFCAAGRLEHQKAFNRLLSSAQRLRAEGFTFHIWLLGEGSLRSELERECDERMLTDIVDFLGYQMNPYPYIKQADAFVSTSRVEGLSMVIGEALVLRTPVIATNCNGQIEALQGGKYGFLVDNSESGVYKGMKAVLTGEYVGNELAYSGSERYLPFRLEDYMQRICSLLEIDTQTQVVSKQ